MEDKTKDITIQASLIILCMIVSILVLALYWSQFRNTMMLEQMQMQIDRNNTLYLELHQEIIGQAEKQKQAEHEMLKAIDKIMNGEQWK